MSEHTTLEIAPGIHQLDTLLGGWAGMTAGFLIEGPEPALVETGSQSSVSAVRAALDGLGIAPGALRWIIVTHIHLDHAGGAGDIARAFPGATVVVHEQGARHLVDPTRLIDSAGRVYGDLLDNLYGRMLPVPQERLVAAFDGHIVDVGNGRRLRLVDSPGHARHHHGVLDEQTGTLLVGDAVGVQLPGTGMRLRPAAPPPEFDLEQAVLSLHRFAELQPTQVVLTHYGPTGDPAATLADAEEQLHRWVDVAERAWRTHDGEVTAVAAALADRFLEPAGELDAATRERMELLNGVHSNAVGISRYLRKREERLGAPRTSPG